MNIITYEPIGIIHSPFATPDGTPIQAAGAVGVEAQVEVFPKYIPGLDDLEGFSHIFLIYHFHLSKKYALKVKPFLDDALHGLFATRAPARPNPIGISVVRLMGITDGRLHVQDIDVVDQTPLLDIKPYVPEFDARKVGRIGWLARRSKKKSKTVDNGRFAS
ncbi:MAG: tRNA (N6-threonylcarbamoyladenosine(37)-N6)-methyltransferase TrmO [Desulfobacterales bacterium]|nr:MAG: tRNA (N6-threonylcarbamoyladenosine(37)-N6)-methyltransferase TrmO [Desulfobacterales bacterium]